MFLHSCTKEQLSLIHAEFGVTEESLKRDAATLIEWLQKQPHLPNVTDEEFIIGMLLRCKTSVEQTKKQLDNYYTGKAVLAKIIPSRTINEKLKLVRFVLMECGFYIPLPKLTPEGYRVLVIQFRKVVPIVPKTEDVLEVLHLSYISLWKLSTHRSTIVIYDLRALPLSLISTFAVIVPKLVEMAYKSNRMRYRKYMILGMSPLYEHLLFLFKKLMPPKEVGKIEFWKKRPEDLVEVIPKDVLPVDFGGTEKSVLECTELWCDEMDKLKDYLAVENSIVADLTKRPKDCQQNADVREAFGLDGTFKNLAVD